MFDLTVGTDIRGFMVLEVLGEGDYGQVGRVRKSATGTEHVLKVSADSETFFNEVEVLRELSRHNSFPKLITHFPFLGTYCLVMSDEGVSIKDFIYRNPHRLFSLRNTLRLGLRLCSVIHELHVHGFVHRDIHAGNCLLKEENNTLVLKLVDYGTTARNSTPESMNSGVFHRRTWFASLNVFRGGPYCLVDDFLASLYILLEVRGEWESKSEANIGHDDSKWEQQKEIFDLTPRSCLNSTQHHFIAELYEAFEGGRTAELDFDGAMGIFFSVVDGFDPTSEFETDSSGGFIRIL